MKAMILCAGHGTRLHPITLRNPKPLTQVLGQPILHHILKQLNNHGVKDVAINTSVMSDKFESSVGSGEAFGMNIIHSFEGGKIAGIKTGAPLGSAGGIRQVEKRFKFFDDSFIVICGDALVDIDFTKMMAFHKSHDGITTIATLEVPLNEVKNYGVVVSDHHGKVSSFQEKPSIDEARSSHANTGIYIFDRKILNFIPDLGSFDIGSELFPKLIEEAVPIYAYNEQFNWIDFGKVSDYAPGCFSILHGQIPSIKPNGIEVAPNIFVGKNATYETALPMLKGPIYIGDGAIIQPGAIIEGPAIIGSGCVVEARTYISKTIISPNKHIHAGAYLRNRVFFEDWVIKDESWVTCIEDDAFKQRISDVSNDVDCILMAGGMRERVII